MNIHRFLIVKIHRYFLCTMIHLPACVATIRPLYQRDVREWIIVSLSQAPCTSQGLLQLRKPSHPSCSIPAAINCLATLLKEPIVRSSFVQPDGVKLLVALIAPASTQQSIQV
ncbi:uncharacterized protein LOC107832039 isoform X2 [Nicotiana tabacum]|uniref:Uncharacterized protein LOC107832039 isoform X2 n=1 Tax=Nicotiana tabacum TaxID=4097 RepID=A0AC58T7U2_TOBAC